jgi:hypothetical protein
MHQARPGQQRRSGLAFGTLRVCTRYSHDSSPRSKCKGTKPGFEGERIIVFSGMNRRFLSEHCAPAGIQVLRISGRYSKSEHSTLLLDDSCLVERACDFARNVSPGLGNLLTEANACKQHREAERIEKYPVEFSRSIAASNPWCDRKPFAWRDCLPVEVYRAALRNGWRFFSTVSTNRLRSSTAVGRRNVISMGNMLEESGNRRKM